MKSASGEPKSWDWMADLMAAREVEPRRREGYRMFLEWSEAWRLRMRLEASRGTVKAFWKSRVAGEEKVGGEDWQLAPRDEALEWYLAWLGVCREDQG